MREYRSWRNTIGIFLLIWSISFAEASSFSQQAVAGARVFNDYCAGCHALHFFSYPMATGLNLNQKLPVFYPPAFPKESILRWLGREPPDLSLVVRRRGRLWLEQFLRGFYQDKSRPFGTNNVLIPNVAMPNVLESLLGEYQRENLAAIALQQTAAGSLSATEADALLEDLTGFLTYVGEPARLSRYRMGFWVIAGLSFFLLLVWRLQYLYFKKLHIDK